MSVCSPGSQVTVRRTRTSDTGIPSKWASSRTRPGGTSSLAGHSFVLCCPSYFRISRRSHWPRQGYGRATDLQQSLYAFEPFPARPALRVQHRVRRPVVVLQALGRAQAGAARAAPVRRPDVLHAEAISRGGRMDEQSGRRRTEASSEEEANVARHVQHAKEGGPRQPSCASSRKTYSSHQEQIAPFDGGLRGECAVSWCCDGPAISFRARARGRG